MKKNRQSGDFEQLVARYLPFILEIRKRLFFVVAIFLIAAIIGFINYERVVQVLLELFAFKGVNIVFTSPFQFISLAVNIGVLLGMIVIFPLLLFQILAFLKPALSPREFKTILSLIPLSLFLFLTGFSFGAVMMRYVVVLFYERTVRLDIGNFLDISLLMSQILTTSILMGVAFQFPILMTLLMRLGIVKYSFFAEKRVFAYAISLIFATLLPPTDIFSLVLLTAPLLVLYELTLAANRFVFRTQVAF